MPMRPTRLSTVTVTQTGDLNNASVESYLGSDNDLTVSQTGNNHGRRLMSTPV